MTILNKELKKRILDISYRKGLSHLGSCLTAVDIIKEIYDTKKPNEKFILSSGHAGLALYVVLEAFGGRNAEEIFDHHGVHPDRCKDCGLEVSAGSLGNGIGIAVGMALADKNKDVYCLISDGECAEGSVDEALRVWDREKVTNLKVYLNFNGYGAYRKIPTLFAAIASGINTRKTNFDLLTPIIKEPQEAHYKVMNEEEYNIVLQQLK